MSPKSASLAIANSMLANPSLNAAQTAALKSAATKADKARTAAEDFESVFLNTLFQQMFSGVGQGPFSGGPAAGVWRSMLTDQYARTFAKAGGIGIADHVQRALMMQQAVR
jgi:Rod binding domain-containing protein